jgi:hypothetical protein
LNRETFQMTYAKIEAQWRGARYLVECNVHLSQDWMDGPIYAEDFEIEDFTLVEDEDLRLALRHSPETTLDGLYSAISSNVQLMADLATEACNNYDGGEP